MKFIIDEHGVIVGDTQTGKTTTAIAICHEMKKLGYTTIFVNTKNDEKLFRMPQFNNRGTARYKDVPLEVFEYLLEDEDSEGIIEVRPRLTDKSPMKTLEKYFDALINFKQQNQSHRVLIVVDELHRLQSKTGINRSLQNIWTMGKGLNLFGLGLSQRGTHISNDIWTQSEIIIMHKCSKRDCRYYYDNRYIEVPKTWFAPQADPEEDYPWYTDIHKAFIQGPFTQKTLVHLPLQPPPF